MTWAVILSGLIKAWNGLMTVVSRFQLIGAWMKGKNDQARDQKDAEDEDRQDARDARDRAKDVSDEDLRRRLRGDDPE